MAAFSSNIDITSGGTYGMDVTNGESSLKVANDLNGKMANIQQYLQNGLPEVWTGDSLPDSLPNGKLLIWCDNLYYNQNGSIVQVALQSLVQSLQSSVSSLQLSVNNKSTLITGTYTGNHTSRSISIGISARIAFINPLSSFDSLNIDFASCISYINVSIVWSNIGKHHWVGEDVYINGNKIYLTDNIMNEDGVVYTYVAMR